MSVRRCVYHLNLTLCNVCCCYRKIICRRLTNRCVRFIREISRTVSSHAVAVRLYVIRCNGGPRIHAFVEDRERHDFFALVVLRRRRERSFNEQT